VHCPPHVKRYVRKGISGKSGIGDTEISGEKIPRDYEVNMEGMNDEEV
jgi:hypothetical protein